MGFAYKKINNTNNYIFFKKGTLVSGYPFIFMYLLIKFIYYNIYLKTSMTKYINIKYPFRDSLKGFFVDLTETDAEAIKSDLMHLILTKKGQRLYKPDFGTNLIQFIFESNESLTLEKIREEITQTVAKYLSKIQINNISVNSLEANDYAAVVRIDYTITDDVFNMDDFVTIKI